MSKSKTPDSTDISVGLSVRAARLVTGMSQAKLAEGLGLTFQQIQKYEKGMNRRELAEKYLNLLHDADRRAVVSLCTALGERDPLPRIIAAERA